MPLDHSRSDLVAAFVASTIAHPHLMACDSRIRSLIAEPAGSAAFLVLGPTGAGKSTLIKLLRDGLIAERRAELVANPQLHPPLVIPAPAPAGSSFSWRDFLLRALDALHDPLVEPTSGDQLRARRNDPTGQFRSVDGVRRAFESAMNYRKPDAIFIDEAQHLTSVGRGVKLQYQLDFIKSLSDATESVFFLVGTYDLAVLRNLNGQLARRTRDIHLARYRASEPDESAAFVNVAYTFANQLPIEPRLLLDARDYVYSRTAGCVGILKEWLVRAFALALEHGDEIGMEHLESTALSAATMTQIAIEIINGETALIDTDEMVETLRETLGLTATPPLPPARGQATRPRPGKRRPIRDLVPA